LYFRIWRHRIHYRRQLARREIYAEVRMCHSPLLRGNYRFVRRSQRPLRLQERLLLHSGSDLRDTPSGVLYSPGSFRSSTNCPARRCEGTWAIQMARFGSVGEASREPVHSAAFIRRERSVPTVVTVAPTCREPAKTSSVKYCTDCIRNKCEKRRRWCLPFCSDRGMHCVGRQNANLPTGTMNPSQPASRWGISPRTATSSSRPRLPAGIMPA
jgi:hypothetical protein